MFCPLYNIAGGQVGRNSPNQVMKKHDKRSVCSDGVPTTVDGVPVRKLFISNLPPLTTNRHVSIAFKSFGKLVDVTVVRPQKDDSKKSIFGFVTFETPAEASRALKRRHSTFILNQKIYIFPADSWHQPLELPNGKILWDRRKQTGDEVIADADGDGDESNIVEEFFLENIAAAEGSGTNCPISKLNDDCLLLIFDCLSMNERLVLNKVCRRWKMLNMRLWHGLRKLDFTVKPLSRNCLTDKLLEKYLSLCPNVSHLNIGQKGHELTSNTIIIIGNHCKNLESLTVRDIPVKKRSLAFLARCCRQLKSFSMDACSSQHDTELISLIKGCSTLEEISFKYCVSSTGLWLKFLQPPLKTLSLGMCDFNPEYLLQGISNTRSTLKELKFVSCEAIRSADVEAIVSLVPELDSLMLAGGFLDFQSSSLTPVTKLKKLTRLELDHNAFVCDHFLNELSQECTLLKYLSLSGIDDRYLTVQGLGVLSRFTGLTHLTLARMSKLNDAMLKSISQKIKNLKHLDLMECSSITDEGCQCIVNNCKNLEVLDVTGCLKVTNLTVTAAIESSSKRTGKKLKIIAGDSGIDLDICWSSEVIIDPSSSIIPQCPGGMFVIDPEYRYDDAEFLNDLYFEEFDEFDDEYGDLFDEDDDDDSLFDDVPYSFVHFACNGSDSELSNAGEYDFYY